MVSKEYTVSCENDENIKITFIVDFVNGLTIQGNYKKKFDESVLLYSEYVDDYNKLLDEEWLFDKLNDVVSKTLIKREQLIKINNFFENFKSFKIEED